MIGLVFIVTMVSGDGGPGGAFWISTMQTNLNPDGTMRDMDRTSGAFDRIGPNGSPRRAV
ncbi:hypothetical protein [Gymnodinialimonas ulvae]|uniref:hypothetical protein n=1 Tax=Gymnodinialimonas ulvae TaxID=3126504 RepID=UPI003099FDF5